MTNHDDNNFEDDLLPRLFRMLGPRAQVPPEMRRRWETTFSAELARSVAARRHRRGRVMAGGFGAVMLLVLAGYLLRQPSPDHDAVVADTTRVTMVSGDATTEGVASGALVVGEDLSSGQTIRTGPRALLALTYRNTDVRLNSESVLVMEPTGLQLVQGEVYVDAGTLPRHGPAVIVETLFGAVTHVGTQFAVAVTDAGMTATVREGAVAFSSGPERRTISASADAATQIVVSATGIETRSVPRTGNDWDWTVAAAPGFIVNDQTADAFLVWAARQTGANLHYSNDAARYHAKTVLLHGDARPLSVAQGLDVINATTDLAVDAADPQAMRVSIRGAQR